ncbi:hypothetical protein [Rhizobium sp. C4]|uniref:hypothetical protein n=1 Tax=Rhizobium sp. C4 TaxID=1349800 RepID=UPI001E54843B|nr:hypothetical protein [Rhizobium sp. C4]MCD2171393.1 hypothetical protein [Rhizobium sp. C4]
MRIQIYIISILASLIAWGMIYDSSRDVYRSAWRAGVIPNLKIHSRVHHILERELVHFERVGA